MTVEEMNAKYGKPQTAQSSGNSLSNLWNTQPVQPQQSTLDNVVGKVKSAVGGFASGVGGVALTAEDYLGRKIVNAVGTDQMKKNLASAPSLNDQFKTDFGGDTNPNTYGAGQLVGEVAALAAPVSAVGKLGAKGAEALGAGKTVTKIAQAGVEGLAFTAGQGLTENKSQSLSDYAVNSGLNMLIPVGGAALKSVAENVPGRIINSLIKPLAKDFAYGKNPGKTIAELGITGNNFDDLITNIKSNLKIEGDKIGQTVAQSKNLSKIELSSTLKPIEEAITAANQTPRTNASLINRLEGVKQDLVDNISKGIDPQSYKGLVGDLTKWTGSVSDDQAVNKALKQVYGSTRAEMDNVLSQELSPEAFQAYKKASDNYGNLLTAKNATEYRDKIIQRQDLISFGSKNAGILGALSTAIATGGSAIPTIIAGIGGIAFDKTAATPAFKTRLASLLSKLGPKEVQTFFEKVPTAKGIFQKNELDSFIKKVQSTPNKQGGFIKIGSKTFKAIDAPTKSEMVKAIDYIRNKQPFDKTMELDIGRLAEKYGISSKSLTDVAKKFEDLIDKTKTTK